MNDYWQRIIKKLNEYWEPGDRIICRKIYKEQNQVCQLCQHHPITWNHILLNLRTNNELIVGSECIHNFKEGLRRLEQDTTIYYPLKYEYAANYINRRYPGTVELIGENDKFDEFDEADEAERINFDFYTYELLATEPEMFSADDLAPEGMGSDEIDWDSYDFEGPDD